MDFFESDLQFSKIIFRNKFYYPPEINTSINELVSYLGTNIKQSNSPFVYLFATNHIKTIIAYFAIIKSNRICVLVDPEIKHIELDEMKQDTPPYAMIIFDKETDAFDYQKDIIFTDNNTDIDSKEIEDVCTMVYTNAEDGFAKAAMLTRKNIITDAEAHATTNHSNKESVIGAFLPFHHLFGLVIGVISPILSRAVILVEDSSNLRRINSISEDFKIYKLTHLYTVPVIYYLLTKITGIIEKLGDINFLISGGYKLPLSIFDFYMQNLGLEIHEGYGLTEASPVCTWNHPDKKVKPGSIGQPFNCCDVKINDRNKFLNSGQIGEICIKGDNVMKGYFNNKNATKNVIKKDWLHTGDLGMRDEDGYFYITGLKKRMLNVSGKNVYPAEVERLIKLNKKVQSVEVYGHFDELQGHTINVKIILKNKHNITIEALKKWCLENITLYKIPRLIQLS